MVLQEDQPVQLGLKIGDELSKVPARHLEEVRLHLLVVNLTPVDALRVEMNGQSIDDLKQAPTLEPGAPTGPHSAFVDLIFDLHSRVPRLGLNSFTVALVKKNEQVRPPVYLRELELSIRYCC